MQNLRWVLFGLYNFNSHCHTNLTVIPAWYAATNNGLSCTERIRRLNVGVFHFDMKFSFHGGSEKRPEDFENHPSFIKRHWVCGYESPFSPEMLPELGVKAGRIIFHTSYLSLDHSALNTG